MEMILSGKDFAYVGASERAFLIALDKSLYDLGFVRTGIGDFARWGNYTVAYLKPHVKAKNYISKVFFDGNTVTFRLYFKDIDQHAGYIERAPDMIKDPFINDEGKCQHCKASEGNLTDDACKHRKIYTIGGKVYEKCDGEVFYFHDLNLAKLNEYMSLIAEFYPVKNKKA